MQKLGLFVQAETYINWIFCIALMQYLIETSKFVQLENPWFTKNENLKFNQKEFNLSEFGSSFSNRSKSQNEDLRCLQQKLN